MTHITPELTNLEYLLLEQFVGRDEISIDELVDRLYGQRRDGGPDWGHSVIWVTKFKLNRKLRAIGLTIVPVFKRPCCYRLTRVPGR
jgi:hypothetical protein